MQEVPQEKPDQHVCIAGAHSSCGDFQKTFQTQNKTLKVKVCNCSGDLFFPPYLWLATSRPHLDSQAAPALSGHHQVIARIQVCTSNCYLIKCAATHRKKVLGTTVVLPLSGQIETPR